MANKTNDKRKANMSVPETELAHQLGIINKDERDYLSDPLDIFGGLTADPADDEARAAEARKRMLGAYAGLEAPELKDITAPNYAWQGDYKPELMTAEPDVQFSPAALERAKLVEAGPSAFEKIQTDPSLRASQMASLAALKDISDNGGMSLTEKANLQRMQSEVGQADRGRRDAIRQNMAARGMGGSGMEMLASLKSGQAATDRASQGSIALAAQAQQRALNALMQQGQMAGQMRSQDYGEQSNLASARDAIAKFNAANANQLNQGNASAANNMAQFNTGNQLRTDLSNQQNRQGVKQTNMAATNQAGIFNTSGRQDAADRRAGGAYNTQIANNTVAGQRFDDDVQIRDKTHQVAKEEAGMWDDAANQKRKQKQEAVGTVGKVFTSVLSDKREKKNIKGIKDDKIMEFLKALKPTEYEYKDPSKPGAAKGKRIGFVMQDIVDTDIGKDLAHENEDGMLMADKDNLIGVTLAALSSLAKGGKKVG